ncbi:MAG: site-2 protease family protein, partial [Clostridiaceae bacterium]|nr:site-2 protease family protein [Clostridiaceae bacterium]
FAIIAVLFVGFSPMQGELNDIIIKILALTGSINCMLFFLNLVPVPGFDGFHILRDLFPKFFYNISDSITRYQFLLFMALIFPILPGGNSVFTYIVGIPGDVLFSFFIKIARMI